MPSGTPRVREKGRWDRSLPGGQWKRMLESNMGFLRMGLLIQVKFG